MLNDTAIQQAAECLRGIKRVAVLTGAGVSAESGVPTFRDAISGLWERYDPHQLATAHAFKQAPKLVWDWYEYRRGLVRAAHPNGGHYALAALEQRVEQFTLITQNVDALHEQAGSRNVLHLHGSIAESKCFFDCQGDPTLVDVSRLSWDTTSGPPPCPHCGRWVRPNVVWFGEFLPVGVLNDAKIASAGCQVMLVVGTSGLVEPAASLPLLARQRGAQVIEVNPQHTPITDIAHIHLQGTSGQTLPRLVDALIHA